MFATDNFPKNLSEDYFHLQNIIKSQTAHIIQLNLEVEMVGKNKSPFLAELQS